MNQSEAETTVQQEAEAAAPDGIEVWVCPNCGSTYHSSNIGDLSNMANRRSSMSNLAEDDPLEWGRVVGHRDQCGHCKNSREAQSHGGAFRRHKVLYIKASTLSA